MGILDPRLRFLKQQSLPTLASLEGLTRFAVTRTRSATPRVRLLLGFQGKLAPLQALGFEPTSVAGDVASGFAPLTAVDEITAVPGVRLVESSRPMSRELDLSRFETWADVVQAPPFSLTGQGVIVGVIDSGIDYRHACFRRADGRSRILAIWDQFLTPAAGEKAPESFGYGVEYGNSDLNAALAAPDPLAQVRHQDGSSVGHGTHVSGIAAGNGRAPGNGAPASTFVGMAPDADLVVVANNSGTNLGDSASTLDALNYIFSLAARRGQPAVVNLSQGDNLGPHDGTSLLERGIDSLLQHPGRAVVKSAGNAGDDDIHASGRVPARGALPVYFWVPEGDTTPDTFDLWYPGVDRLEVCVVTPTGHTTAVLSPGQTDSIALPNGNQVFIDSTTLNPFNSDNRIYLQLLPGDAPAIAPGLWAILLLGRRVVQGRFDVWLERDAVRPVFVGPTLNRNGTLTIPGTAQRVITVGNYVTRLTGIPGEYLGYVASTSSVGPTRDGRVKPELAAPGQSIVSARAGGSGDNQYRSLAGTSMAAPHVTGLIALLLQRAAKLAAPDLVRILTESARREAALGEFPNVAYGYGKIDSRAAVARLDALVKSR